MDAFHYEIVHTADGAANAEVVRALIGNEAMLMATSRPWVGTSVPASADLYALLVIASEHVGGDPTIHARVQAIMKRRFPCMLVVASCDTYDFRKPPFPELATANAVGLDRPDFVVETLLHHAGLRHHGTGGQVFISYARRDGTPLAEALRAGLKDAGFRAFMDCHEIVGGVAIQRQLSQEMLASDLVLVIDSQGAAASPWVAEELDLARVAHVPVMAVTPARGAFHHAFTTPHVPWETGDDIAAVAGAAVVMARRLLARQVTFCDRVARTLERVCMLRGWELAKEGKHWLVRPAKLRVACTDQTPTMEAVMQLCDVVGPGRGMLVGGTRPYPIPTVKGLARVGGDQVCTTPLPRMASKIPSRIAPRALQGRRVFLSASMPDVDDVEDSEHAAQTLGPFLVTFIQTMVDLGATVVFGGHPTVTPLVHKAIVDIAAEGAGVELHVAAVWAVKGALPAEADDRRVFRSVTFHGGGTDPAQDVAALRDGMIRPGLDAGVFVGGKTRNYIGDKPGILDEYERFRAACPKAMAFILGLGGGAATRLLDQNEPPGHILDPRVTYELRTTADPDLATALIIAEMIDRSES